MGSAVRKTRDESYALTLMQELARLSDASAEPPVALAADLIADALADPACRRAVLLEVSGFILEALAGFIPNPRKR